MSDNAAAAASMKSPLFDRLLYGGDYNPEQWMNEPGIWDEDMRLMRLAGVNTVSLGIFSWVSLEPKEGHFDFGWMDRILDRLAENGVRANLATPSGAKPAWMSRKYPEIRRVQQNGLRDPHQGRHNHCLTSPVYREKVAAINTKLAERYKDHPALQMWHISNEYGGYCYCGLCFSAFQKWLRKRYNDDLDALNKAWWTRFWSHTYTEWDQIDAIDNGVHGMQLDWRRFMTDQCISFIEDETAPLRQFTPHIPITTNFMGTYDAYNYWKMARHLDVVCWDAYPEWHGEKPDHEVAASLAFTHDIYRALKGGDPWLLMETTPSVTNWQPVSRPRRPGVNRLNGLQAIAHGSDSVLYFQWRKSRGSSEKFHGAVVDHVGHENTRIFRECAALGEELGRLAPIAGSRTPAEVALVYDWENAWAIQQMAGPRNKDKNYRGTVESHYRPFWKRGIAVDVIDSTDTDFSAYKLLIAPMLYLLRPGVAARISQYVENGGVFVATYLTGIADENDLVFLGGFPGPLRPVLGIWSEETDVLHDHQSQTVTPTQAGEGMGLSGDYAARHLCDIIHPEGAETLAVYGDDFYAGGAALTVNRFGQGRAYYVASRNDDRFTDDFLSGLIADLSLRPALPGVALPEGVSATRRVGADGRAFAFLMNFTPQEASVDLGASTAFTNLNNGSPVSGLVTLPAYGALVLAAGR